MRQTYKDSSFHNLGATTAKAPSPLSFRLILGTLRKSETEKVYIDEEALRGMMGQHQSNT